jgi:hypothetical protein
MELDVWGYNHLFVGDISTETWRSRLRRRKSVKCGYETLGTCTREIISLVGISNN